MMNIRTILLGIVAALGLSCATAEAQFFTPTFASFPSNPPATYAGACDVVSGCVSYWGLRAASVATRGSNAINLCNVLDAVCVDVASDASTGMVVIPTVGGSSCAVVTCTIKSFYDPISGNTQTQATIANRATLTVSCVNAQPCAVGTGSVCYESVNSITWASPQTHAGFVNASSGFWSYTGAAGGAPITLTMRHDGTNNLRVWANTNFDATATDGVWYAPMAVFNGSSSLGIVNGSATGGSTSTYSFSAKFDLMSLGGCGNQMNGSITEMMYFNAAKTAGDAAALSSNQAAFW